jgi:hypothetical protein
VLADLTVCVGEIDDGKKHAGTDDKNLYKSNRSWSAKMHPLRTMKSDISGTKPMHCMSPCFGTGVNKFYTFLKLEESYTKSMGVSVRWPPATSLDLCCPSCCFLCVPGIHDQKCMAILFISTCYFAKDITNTLCDIGFALQGLHLPA